MYNTKIKMGISIFEEKVLMKLRSYIKRHYKEKLLNLIIKHFCH